MSTSRDRSRVNWLKWMSRTGRARRRARHELAKTPWMQLLETRQLMTIYTVTEVADSGPGSLRQAILDSDSAGGTNTIDFNIAPAGFEMISLDSALPDITDNVTIDATTQGGYAGTPLIQIDGTSAGAVGGLTFASSPTSSDGSTVKGLIISNFSGGAGITINSANVTVQGNWIGSDSTGSNAAPDAVGIAITGSGNTIGGAAAADANVISGNTGAGVTDAGTSSPENVVLNNLIGVNAGSSSNLPNGGGALAITSGASVLAGGSFTGDISDSATLDLGGNAISIVGALTGTGTVTNNAASGTATLTVNGTGTFSGVIQDGSTAHTALTEAGGEETLTGTNSYSGATMITSAGILQIGNGGTTGTLGSTTITDNGTLVYDYSSSFNLTKAVGGSGTLNLTSTAGAITQGVAITVGSVAANGATGVTLNGPGNTFSTFAATNITSGAISLTDTASTLVIGSIADLGAGGAVTINDTGSISVSSILQTASGGAINLTATGGALTETGGITTTGTLTTSTATGATLFGTNAVGTFHATNSTSGAISLTNTATTLTVTGITQSGTTAGSDVAINQTGNFSLTGAISTTAAANGNIGVTTSGGMTIGAGVTAGGSGTLNLIANPTGTTTGNFDGIDINGVIIQSTTGNVLVQGSGSIGGGRGVQSSGAASIRTTGATGSVTIIGTAGNTTSTGAFGVVIGSSLATVVSTGGGNVSITGTAGGTGGGTNDTGVEIVSSTVTAGGSGTVTISGTGGGVSTSGDDGVDVDGTVTSSGGNVSVTGVGGTSTGPDTGVLVSGQVTAGGTGTVSVTGTGQNGASGVWVTGSVTSTGGGISVTSLLSPILVGAGGFVTAPGANSVIISGVGITIAGRVTSTSGAISATSSGNIGESGSGFISTTGTLTTSSVNGQVLGGANAVGTFSGTGSSTGSIILTNTATTLTLTGVTESSGAVTINNTGNIAVTGAISAGAGQNVGLTSTGSLSESGGGSVRTSGAGIVSLVAGSTGIGSSGSPFAVSANNLDSTTSGNGNEFLSATGPITIDATGLNAGTGTVTLDAGTFTLGGSNRINASTELNVSGATFAMGTFSDTVATVMLTSGLITGTTGVLTSTNTIETESGTISAILAGTNGLTQSTGGTTTLTDNNTYSGGTTITAGTLVLGAGGTTGSLGSGPVVDNATLTYLFSNSINVTSAISGSGTLNLATTGGAIAQATPITVASLVASAATGITLSTPGNSVSSFSATNTTSGAISLTNTATTLTVGAITETGGAVTINNTGAIAATGTVSTTGGGAVNLTASGSISESGAGSIGTTGTLTTSSSAGASLTGANTANTFTATNSSSGAISLTNTSTTLTVSGITQSGTSAGSNVTISQSGALSVTGGISTTAAANGAIGLTSTAGMTVTAGLTAGGSGNLTLIANQTGATSGGFNGIMINGPTFQSGSGIVLVEGVGGSGAGGAGVVIQGGGTIQTTGGTGTVSIDGTGGNSTSGGQEGIIISGSGVVVTSGGGNVSITGVAGGSGAASAANIGVLINSGAQVSAGGTGTVTVQGTGGGTGTNNNWGVDEGGTVTSSGGNVAVTGVGGGIGGSGNTGVIVNGQVTAGGTGTVNVTGTGQGGNGVLVTGTVNSTGGNISVTSLASGLIVNPGAFVTAPGANSVNLAASNGVVSIQGSVSSGSGPINATASSFIVESGSGVFSTTGTLTTVSSGGQGLADANTVSGFNATNTTNGAISLTNTSTTLIVSGITQSGTSSGSDVSINQTGALTTGGAISTTAAANGVISLVSTGAMAIDAAVTAGGSGNLTLTANSAGTTTGNFTGILIDAVTVQSTTGAVLVQGTGGNTGSSNFGVDLFGPSTIQTTGATGTVTVQGTGGTGSGGLDIGVFIEQNGNFQNGLVTSGGGNVSVTGQGGAAGTGASNIGIEVQGGTIKAGGLGTVTVNGTGGASTGNSNVGVLVNFPSTSTITSGGGAVSVTGTGGGTGASASNVGVGVDQGTISAGGSGTVTVVGTHGDVGGTGNSNVGIEVSGAVGTPGIVTSNSGDISLNGQGQGGTTGYGVYLNNGDVTAPGAHNVTITSSSVYGNGLISSTSGSIGITATAGMEGSASTGGAGVISLSAGSGGIGGSSLIPFVVSGNNLDATTSGNGNEFLTTTGSITIDATGLNAGTGTVNLDGGTFTLGGSNRINDNTKLNVNGSTFAIGAFSETVATVTLTSDSITGTTGVLTSTNTIQTESGTISAILAGTNGLTQSTAGTTTLSASNLYTGTTTLNGGTLLVDGAITGAVMVNAAGTLGGHGSVGAVTDQGAVSPGDSPGILTINGNYSQTGSLTDEMQGTVPGTGYDQLIINGSVSLGGALNPSLLGGFLPSLGNSFQLITNDGTDAVDGTFAGLPQNATFNVGPRFFTISYDGGTGNDVVITAAGLAVTNTSNSGVGSLRQAILNADLASGPDIIDFAIAGAGVQTISPISALPTVTNTVTIDGTTQTGYSGTPLIQIDGSSAGAVGGLSFNSGSSGSTVEGLIISNFSGAAGITLNSNDNVVQGNWIGTDATGTAAAPNSSGVWVNGIGNTVGGTLATDRNVLSGNVIDGVAIVNAGATANVVVGNYIGVDLTGTVAVANGMHGVEIYQASGNTVGGSVAGAGNVVSGNAVDGVVLQNGSSLNTVAGNFVGTNFAGTAAIPNGQDGVEIALNSTNNIIGGVVAAARNIISGNAVSGVDLSLAGVTGNKIEGNFIGTDVTGLLRLANGANGVIVQGGPSGNTIGGLTATPGSGAGNVISGNTSANIAITGQLANVSAITVVGNLIGTTATGSGAITNGQDGIEIFQATNNVIGGTLTGSRNVISANARYGVSLFQSATGNLIEGNSIGINLAGSGALGNHGGVYLDTNITSSDNTIGGVTAGAANTIAFNTADGVQVNSGTDDPIRGNSIYSNGGLGIELGSTSLPSQNILGGSNSGPNLDENYPVLDSVAYTSGSGTTIVGDVNTKPNTTVFVDFYSNPGAVLPAYGQGQVYLGATMVTTGVDGGAQFIFNAPALVKGSIISATMTDAAGNTSEFALDMAEDNPPSAVFVAKNGTTPATTFNASQTITFDASASVSPDAYPLTYSWDFGDHTVAMGLTATHAFAYDGTYVVTLTVNDGHGGIESTTEALTIDQTPLTVTLDPLPASATVGTPLVVSGTVADAVSNPMTLVFAWGDGTAPKTVILPAGQTTFSTSHTFTSFIAGGLPANITVTATDFSQQGAPQPTAPLVPLTKITPFDAGGATGTAAASINVVAPLVSVSGLTLSSTSINENDQVNLKGTIVDPFPLASHTVTISWGDGPSAFTTIKLNPGALDFSANYRYLNNPALVASGAFTILVTVTNNQGITGTASASVTVSDVAPTVAIETLAPSGSSSLISLFAAVTDPGTLDSHTYQWSVNSTPVASATQPGFTFNPKDFSPDSGGVYQVAVTVTDDVGETGQANASLLIGPSNDGNNIVLSESTSDQGPQVTETITPLNSAATSHTFAPGNAVYFFTNSSGNFVTIDPSLTLPAELVSTPGGNNTLKAGSGNDTLFSAQGADTLIGTTGPTTFVLVLAGTDQDPVLYGSTGINTIDLSQTPQNITLNLGVSSTLPVDSEGDEIDLASGKFQKAIAGSGNDSLIGAAGVSTTLVGGAGNDLLYGGGTSGSSLVGGSGNATLVGGGGNSIIYGSGSGNSSVVGGTGNSTVVGGGGNSIIFGSTGGGSTSVVGGTGNATVVGGGGNSIIYGSSGGGSTSVVGGAGNTTVVGGGGNSVNFGSSGGDPTVVGGLGNTTVVGGAGNSIIYGSGSGGTSVVGGTGNATVVGGGGNSIIYGSSGGGGTSVVGGTGNSTVVGGSGNSINFGTSGGNPTLVGGGAGNTTVVGGAGNSVIYGSGSGDVSVVGGTGNSTVVGGSGNSIIYGSSGGGGTSVVGGTGNSTVVGGSGNSINFGSSGGNPTLVGGGAGNTTVVGGAGNSIIYGSGSGGTSVVGGTGNATVVGGGGNSIIYGSSGGGGTSVVGGTGNSTVVGGSGNSINFGTSGGNPTLVGGGAGNTTVVGGAGNSVIYGSGSGDVSVVGGTGNSTVVGGSGNSIIYGSSGGGGTSVVGGTGNATVVGGSGNSINFGSSGGNPTLVGGGSGNTTVVGGAGNSIIYGSGSGDTSVVGGTGNATVVGGSGNSIVYGSSGGGNTSVVGGTGNATVVGGGGNSINFGSSGGSPTVVGGAGNTTVVGGSGNSIIYGSGSGNTSVRGGTGNATVVGGGGNSIIYGSTTGTSSLIGGTGNATIVGGGGNSIIYGGTGNDSLVAGSGASTLSGGGGSDILVGNALSVLDEQVSANAGAPETVTLTNSSFSVPGFESETLSGFGGFAVTLGSGQFILNASNTSAPTELFGGTGNDTILAGSGEDSIYAGTGIDSLVGGSGQNDYVFGQNAQGNVTINSANDSNDTLDFSQFTAGTNLDLEKTGPQNVSPGLLTLTITNPLAITMVYGTPNPDTIMGNGAGATLIGNGGSDYLDGRGGAALIEGAETQVVYLNFQPDLPALVSYASQSIRDSIQARMEAIYGDFNYVFTQTIPASGPYAEIYFNEPAGTYLGGEATELDFRNLDLGGSATVDISQFLQFPGQPAVAGLPSYSTENVINMSATIAAHELGHLSGLLHEDAFGPIGTGVSTTLLDNPNLDGFHPAYGGPSGAPGTPYDVMSSPASVGSSLYDATRITFFGERDAIKLAFADSGTTVNEATGTNGNYSLSSAQTITLTPLAVPNTLVVGQDVGMTFDVSAINVDGAITLNANGTSNVDYYAFTANAGQLFNFEVLSTTISRYNGDDIDPELTLLESDGQTIVPYGTFVNGTFVPSTGGGLAMDDDSFQDQDSYLYDVKIPKTGAYYLEVNAFAPTDPFVGVTHDSSVGRYELFAYSFATTSTAGASVAPMAGDTLIGGSGHDTLVGSSANDLIAMAPMTATAPGDVVYSGSGADTLDPLPTGLSVTGSLNALTGSFVASNVDLSYTTTWHVVASNGQSIPDVSQTYAAGQLSSTEATNVPFILPSSPSGDYEVMFTVTDGLGIAQSVTTTEVVGAPLTVPITEGGAAVAGPIVTTLSIPVTLSATGATTYAWTANDSPAESGSSSNFNFSPTEAGTYTVTLTATDASGDVSQSTVTVIVAEPSVQILGAPSNLYEAEGSPFTLSSLVNNAPADSSVAWTITPGSGPASSGMGPNFTYSLSDIGTYTVTASLLDANGTTLAVTTQQIIGIGVAPVASISGGPSGGTSPEGTAVNFFSTASNPSAAQGFFYKWTVTLDGFVIDTSAPPPTSLLASLSQSPSSFQFTPAQAGTYVVSVSAFDYHGFQGQNATETINVTAVPQSATITGLPTDSTADLGAVLSLGASVTAATTALQTAGFIDTWTVAFGGATYGPYSGPSLNLTADGVGLYSITLTTQDAEGVTNSTTSLINIVDPSLDVTSSGSTQNGSTDASTAFGLGTVNGAALAYGGGTVVVNWGDDTSSTYTFGSAGALPLAPHQYALPGDYLATETITDSFGAQTRETFTAVVAGVPPSASILGLPSTVNADSTVTFGSSVSDPSQAEAALGFTYAWSVTRNGASYTFPDNFATDEAGFTFEPVEAGTYVITLAATDNNKDVGYTTATFTVTQSTPVVSVTASNATYNGSPFSASPVTTVDGTVTTTGVTYTYTVLGSSIVIPAPTDAGTYTVTANFAGSAQYTAGSASANFAIYQAAPTVSVTAANDTYNGSAFNGSPVTTVNGTVTNSGITYTYTALGSNTVIPAPTDAGTYTVTASYAGSTDYTAGSASANFTIAQATPTVSVTDSNATYNGSAFNGSPVTTVNGTVTNSGITYTYTELGSNTVIPAPTDAGTYTVTATYPGSTDYTARSASANFTIAQATPTVSVTDSNATYNGSAFNGSPVTTVNGTVTNSGITYTYTALGSSTVIAAPTDAGTYTVTATYPGSTDYTAGSASANFTIAQATPTVSVTDSNATYNGSAFNGSPVTTVNGTVTSSGITYTYTALGSNTVIPAPTDAGTYTVTATYPGSTDYTAGSASANFTIAQATPTVSVTDSNATYNGSAFNGSPVTTVNGTVTNSGITYTYTALGSNTVIPAPTDAGTYTVTATYPGSTDYTAGSASANFTIAQATPTVSVTDSNATYNGSPFNGSPVTTVNGAVATSGITYTYTALGSNTVIPAPTDAGTYTVTATYPGSTDYTAGSASANFTIAQATPTISVTDSNATYNGSAFNGSPVTTVNGAVTTNGITYTYTALGSNTVIAAPTHAGTYTVKANFAGSADYTAGSASANFTIFQATPMVSVTDSNATYNGSAFNGSPVTTVNGAVTTNGITYTYTALGSNTVIAVPTHAGTYTVKANYAGSADYTAGSASANFTISAASTSVSGSTSGTFVGTTSLTATVTSAGGTPAGSVDFYDSTTMTDLGSASLNSAGTATLNLSVPIEAGAQSIVLTFSSSTADFSSTNATIGVNEQASIYVLNATAGPALSVSGSSTVTVPGTIQVASSSSNAIVLSGNSKLTATTIGVFGGTSVSGSSSFGVTPTKDTTAPTDPLANLPIPSATGMTTHTAVNLGGASSLTIAPGIYPSINVSGSGKLTLQPGIYVITGGGFSVSGAGVVSGSGVLIYNAGSNYNAGSGNSFGAFAISGSGALNLTAPTSGTYAGIVIFQSRDNSHAMSLSGAAMTGIAGGTIYAPDATLTLSGSTQVGGSGQSSSTLIVNELALSGATGAYQLTDGTSSDADVSTFNWITSPVLTVAAEDDTGAGLDPNEVADLGDAMTYLNQALGSFGVNLSWVPAGTTADVTVHFADTTPEGGVADGVLGFTTPQNDVYFVAGWNYSTSTDPNQVGADQFDFMTLAVHELGHTLGLGESQDPNSVMYEYLAPGTVRRTFTDTNLTLIDTDADRFMKVASGLRTPQAIANPVTPLAVGPATFVGMGEVPSVGAAVAASLPGDPSISPVVQGTLVPANSKSPSVSAFASRSQYFRKSVATSSRLAKRAKIADRILSEQSNRIDAGFTSEPAPQVDSSRSDLIDLALDQMGAEHGPVARVANRARRD